MAGCGGRTASESAVSRLRAWVCKPSGAPAPGALGLACHRDCGRPRLTATSPASCPREPDARLRGGRRAPAARVCPPQPAVPHGPGMYMQVETRTSSCLHLKRAPGIRSWSLLVGILSIGLAAAYYSADSLGWKLFYVTGCLFVAVQNLEDWEEAVFNKSTGKVVLKTFSLYKKLLTLSRVGHDQVVVLLNDIRDVNVEEEKVRYFGKGYVVVLRFATGFSHPLTQSAVMGHRSPREAPCSFIRSLRETTAGPSLLPSMCRGRAWAPWNQTVPAWTVWGV